MLATVIISDMPRAHVICNAMAKGIRKCGEAKPRQCRVKHDRVVLALAPAERGLSANARNGGFAVRRKLVQVFSEL